MPEVKQSVPIVGAGAMGSQIALVAALAGYAVRLFDLDATALARAERQLRDRMATQIAKGRRTAEEVSGAFARLHLHNDLPAAADGDLPSRTVTELVEAGHLGRKTGRGFYTYDTPGA